MKKKFLITGANGFIGSHLVEYLHNLGYEIRALNEYNSFNNWGHLEKLACLDDIEVISGDIKDGFFCEELARGCDGIFHLASLIAIPYSYKAPLSYANTNIIGTINMLEAAKKANIKAFIHTSTSEVYGSACYLPMDEKHPLNAQSPYAASKIAADMMAKSYYTSFNLPVIIARPFNTYGPRQSARAFIPSVITQLLNGATSLRVGDLSPKRDLNYVADTCAAFHQLLSLPMNAEVYNIGQGLAYSMKEVLDLIQKLLASKAKIIEDKARLRPKNSEVTSLLCDASKLKRASSWQSTHSLEEGLKKSIEWFLKPENLKAYKSWLYNT